jgi:hypothetical protein
MNLRAVKLCVHCDGISQLCDVPRGSSTLDVYGDIQACDDAPSKITCHECHCLLQLTSDNCQFNSVRPSRNLMSDT